jgi:signal transduction histidine kinase
MRARSILRPVLAVPLWAKLVGANALIVLIAAVALTRTASQTDGSLHLGELFLGAFVVSVALNIALVVIALRPLRALEDAAAEVWRGNAAARVPDSPLADRDMARVGHTINHLVDALLQESTRSRELAAFVISQAESDQARIAHELHESAAQRMAAQVMQISVIARDTNEEHTRARLDELHDATSETLEQLRKLVRTMNVPVARAGSNGSETGETSAANTLREKMSVAPR